MSKCWHWLQLSKGGTRAEMSFTREGHLQSLTIEGVPVSFEYFMQTLADLEHAV